MGLCTLTRAFVAQKLDKVPKSHMQAHLLFLQALDLDSITTHHWLHQGCSAVTAEILLGIDWIVDHIASRIFTMTKNLHLLENF